MRKLYTILICGMFLLNVLPAFAQCDVLQSVNLGGDTPVVYIYEWGGGEFGYFSGNCAFQNGGSYVAGLQIAEKFNVTPGYVVNGAGMAFGLSIIQPTDSAVPIKIYLYDDNGALYGNIPGGPGMAIDSATVTLRQIADAVNAQDGSGAMSVHVSFINNAIITDSAFFISVQLPQNAGDTIALLTNTGDTYYGNGWVDIADNGWISYDTLIGSLHIGNYISADVCPGTLTVMLNAGAAACTGSNLIVNPRVIGGTRPYSYAWSSTGSALSCSNCSSPSVTLTQNSVYTITVTDAQNNTVTASASYTLNAGVNNMQISVLNNTVINCVAGYNNTALGITGGTAPFVLNWGNTDTTVSASVQPGYAYTQPGPVVITVTDSNNCVSALYDTITSNAPVLALTSEVLPGCPGSPTGQIVLAATGGTMPYDINPLDTIMNLTAGVFTLTMTDAQGCHATWSGLLPAAADNAFYVFLNGVNANCNVAGQVNTSVGGGFPPYTYNWSSGQTTNSIQPLQPGNYFVSVTDSLGCVTTGYKALATECVSTISGIAFFDANGNCVLDSGEQRLVNYAFVLQSARGDYGYAYTDSSGYYSVQVADTGTYTFYFFDGERGNCGFPAVCSSNNIFVPFAGDTLPNNNITFSVSQSFNLGIHPGWTSANPGFTKQYWVLYYNSSPLPYTGQATITFVYDSNLIYTGTDVSPAPVNNTAMHTLTWTVDSVPGNFNNFNWTQLDANFMVPQTLSTSYLLQSSFTITPISGDCDSTDNAFVFSETVTGSHDPNEKTVSPAGPVTEADSVLTYTIHFQNTGTDSTHFVIIKDTLSANLDAATVRNIASSDKYSNFTISGKGILTWTFNPLRIVDSATNPSGSKRFVMFSVKKKPGLAIGTTISNKASIYFDYNDAVVTNTVTDTAALPTYIFEIPGNAGINVNAFPNPFSDVTHIVVSGLNTKFGFELYDVTGRLQQSVPSISNNQFDLSKGQLANGVYLYRILIADKPAAYGKLVVE